ncbi:hypothetical protein EMIHUDRAFT_198466 [Emiliania huxleyi CCMP1516]|uniref:Uncharacterized protein n=2 Tax=Emiliania huxleyi TaxID=2903 RepID=A0A0D3I7C0_EMIH1|nr:hypothetical protein EMIHUDRAFT_198466 [Emiliania huxleyi CCMP1516]EOD07155.1 hypothetical protein EMIHUDRAFT_198466 [Emiliania huxleyi CCMP1516]|eukprot:XP_005759584.1 hypothetical protein EMIHUDRAFT_198466 [Emiliania huxleyi CCMP1516]
MVTTAPFMVTALGSDFLVWYGSTGGQEAADTDTHTRYARMAAVFHASTVFYAPAGRAV